jgi:hypothetical protein
MKGQQGYRVRLIEIEEAEDSESVFEADTLEEVQAWLGEWMREPIALAVVVLPPKEASAV